MELFPGIMKKSDCYPLRGTCMVGKKCDGKCRDTGNSVFGTPVI